MPAKRSKILPLPEKAGECSTECNNNQLNTSSTSLDDLQSGPEMPNVLFAPDGRKFFPCKYCCRAFAYKRGLVSHVKTCTFKVVTVSDSEEEDMKAKEETNDQIGKQNGVRAVGKREIPSDVFKNEVPGDWDLEGSENNTDVQHTAKEEIKIWEHIVIKPTTRELSPIPDSFKVSAKTKQDSKNGMQRKMLKTNKIIEARKFKEDNERVNMSHSNVTEDDSQSEKRFIEINKEVVCNFCSEIFKNAIDLLRHKRENHTHKKIKLSQESLKIYDKIYQSSGKNICPVCLKPAKKSTWQRHLQIHSAQLRYFCSICKKGFNRIDHQRDHEKRHVVSVEEL